MEVSFDGVGTLVQLPLSTALMGLVISMFFGMNYLIKLLNRYRNVLNLEREKTLKLREASREFLLWYYERGTFNDEWYVSGYLMAEDLREELGITLKE